MSDPLATLFPDEFLISAVAEVPVQRKGGWAELFLERCETTRGEWDARAGLRILPGIREGFALRRADGSRQEHFAVEGLDPDWILAACRNPAAPPAGDFPPEREIPPAEGPEEAERCIVSMLRTLSEQIEASVAGGPGLSLSLERRQRSVAVISPGQAPRRECTTRAVLTCRLPSLSGEFTFGAGAPDLDLLLERHPPERLAREIHLHGEWEREARDAPEGESVVLLAPGTGGVFFHEACGHALEGDLVIRGASNFRDLLGERVAPEFVGAMDDSSRPGLEGSYRFDDEGSPSRGTVLIAGGKLAAFLTDRVSGGRLGSGTTGNGRRESFRDLPLPRMSNTFLTAGGANPEEILRETPRGIFVRRLEGGRVDTATGEFLFRADSGNLIEGGRMTAPLRPFSIAGNSLAALRGIERVGEISTSAPGRGPAARRVRASRWPWASPRSSSAP